MIAGLMELITVLRNNPPYIESHVKALECEVELAGMFTTTTIHIVSSSSTEHHAMTAMIINIL